MKKNLLILFFVASSCQFFFDDNKKLEKNLLEKRIKEINWQKVDKFPMILSCDLLKNDSLRKKCFFEFIEQTIKEKLTTTLTNKNKIDTVLVKICVSEVGKLDFEIENNAQLDSIIKSSLIGFPRVTPAMKQGIYVKTQFNLNIIYSK